MWRIHFFVVVQEISKCTLQSTWGHEDNRVDCYKKNCFFSSDLHLLFQVAVWFWLPKRQNPQNYCLQIIIHHRGVFIMAFFCTGWKCSMEIKSFHHFPGKPFVKNHAVIIISIIWICPPHPSISQSLIGTSGKHNTDLIICLPIVMAPWKINDVSNRMTEKHRLWILLLTSGPPKWKMLIKSVVISQ